MSMTRVDICLGYVGMTLYYHTIFLFDPPASSGTPTVSKKFKTVQSKEIMLSPRRKFFQIHKKNKTSTNYEGQGKNKK